MPTALLLSLRPLGPATVALHVGRASHAAFLSALDKRDPVLAQRLHNLPGIKPFAASDLFGAQRGCDGRCVHPERTYGLRWSGLSAEMDEWLRTLADAPPSEIELDGVHFAVEQATLDPTVHEWAGTAEWSDLVGLDRVGREAPPHRFQLHFLAPTTFRSNGRNIPLPLPDLVFGSLLDRWNSSAPIPLPSEVRRFAAECVVLGRYTLQSTHVASYAAGETAFTGRCTFVATNRDRYYLHCCAVLLRLAFFSGVGAKASMGFGMVRCEFERPH